ncbi:site-2 protease family protein [Candidatus Marithrix sp. Canyon 246]|uniref:site-2 protease family protein n=1 Tax=Candidatus Marithrix sp. Canyon 246 TaxID=1827136 RepID=UPI00084A2041|nr:site-2 protease family protein [Candidatus Marithrix sp. Canyon 246]
MNELTTLQLIAIWILPVIFAITLHEVGHGWAAFKLGDNTAHQLGRITVNPIKHIDPIGTVILPSLLLIFTGFVFGWAKPVPVNFQQLNQPRRDMALVALAGPGANLLMLLFWAIIINIGFFFYSSYDSAIFFIYVGQAGVIINFILMLLNLLPILPLDGGRVVHAMLPLNMADKYGRLEPFGIIVLIVLLLTGVLQQIMQYFLGFMQVLLQFLIFINLN